jgi:hypothetical protein
MTFHAHQGRAATEVPHQHVRPTVCALPAATAHPSAESWPGARWSSLKAEASDRSGLSDRRVAGV